MDRMPMPRPDATGKEPAHITDHAFRPPEGGPWYETCGYRRPDSGNRCRLSEAVHRDTLLKRGERGKVLNAEGPWDG